MYISFLVLVIGDISHLGDVVQLISQAGLPCPNGQRALCAVHGSSPTSGQLLSQRATFDPVRNFFTRQIDCHSINMKYLGKLLVICSYMSIYAYSGW